MKLLAVDTSTEACSAALFIDGRITERYQLAPRKHSHLILGMVDGLMTDAGIDVSELDVLAFGQGPGSFMGYFGGADQSPIAVKTGEIVLEKNIIANRFPGRGFAVEQK